MLRAVRLKNFVKFKDDQFLNFERDGVYLFVGENSSGKSGVLEAVRRCLGISINGTFSTNSVLPGKNAYVVCKFSLTEGGTIVTSFVYAEGPEYAQVVVKTGLGESKDEVCMDLIRKGNDLNPATNVQCIINEDEKDHLITNLKEAIDNKPIETFLSYVAVIIKRQNQHLQGTSMKCSGEESATQKILKALCEQVVFTFGLRSIGEVQWSKASNIRDSMKNYPSAADRSQVINWFEENKGMNDPVKTKNIFNILTCGEAFHFERVEGKRVLTVKNDEGNEFSILQTPEGILEAYHISLLLSCDKFQTLLLEEPDRGMHPQMIQRLKSIVLPAEKNKIIIITSHNSAFLSSKLILQTFKFCKLRANGTKEIKENSIVNIGEAICKLGGKMPRLIADERFANVLFAKRVLLVEGDSDCIFTNALFSHLLNPENEDSTKRIFDLVSDLNEDLNKIRFSSEDLMKLKDLLTSLYIMKLGGSGEKDRWHAFCENTMTPCLLLLNAYAVLDPSTDLSDTEYKTCLDAIHKETVTQIEKKEMVENEEAEQITKPLKDRFLEGVRIKEKNREFGIIYGNKYIKEIKQWRKTTPLKSKNLEILPKEIGDSFKREVEEVKKFCDWDKARQLLQDRGIYVWKYGDMEDTFLELILIDDEFIDRFTQISSLNIDLKAKKFRRKLKKKTKKAKKKNKLYINEKISDEDINKSIDLVIEFCNKDSDIVHFIHFLTKYAKKNIF